MKKLLVLLCCLLTVPVLYAQDAQSIIAGVNRKFAQVNDYTADAHMTFDIPGVRIRNLDGKAYYKRPDKFRIRAKGIFFLPKHNMGQQLNTLLIDTRAYTAVLSGNEAQNGITCAVISVIPVKSDGELVIARLWIDATRSLILRSQITTRNNGTVETFNTFGANAGMALPSSIKVQVETGKFKVPKMFAADINKGSSASQAPPRKYGTIQIDMHHYKINTRLKDAVFTEKDE